MGMDIHIKIVKYNKEENLYKELKLFRPGVSFHYEDNGHGIMNKVIDDPNYEKVDVFSGRDSEMFDGMKEGDDINGYGVFPSTPIFMNSLDPVLKEELEKTMNTQGYFDFSEINLAEMKIYTIEHPTVVDYDADWENWKNTDPKPQKVNPIKELFEDICNYIYFADGEYWWGLEPLSNYKVIFYFDW